MAAEKKLRAEKLLKPTASEDILNLKIELLGIPNEVLSKLKAITSLDPQMNRKPTFTTIEDLLNAGRAGLLNILFKNGMRYIDADAFVVKVEEKLAKIGLKFEDSEFTVLDVPITELEVSGRARKLLNTLSYKVTNLCDLSIQNKLKLIARCENDGRVIVKEIERAMEKYGVKFVESSYKLDKDKFFPTDKLVQHEIIEIKNNEKNNREKRVAIKLDNREKALNLDVSQIGISDYVVGLINENLGVHTIGELLQFTPMQLHSAINGNVVAINTIRDFLKTNSLKMKSGKRAGWKDKIKVKTVDFKNITPEERVNVLEMPIESIGITQKTIERFNNLGIFKIGDLQGRNRESLKQSLNNNSSIMKKINYISKKFDIDMVYDKKLGDHRVVENVFDFASLTQEGKEAIKEKPLTVLGLTKYNCKVLEDTLNIKKVSDIFAHTKIEIIRTCNNSSVVLNKIKKAFDGLGFSFAKCEKMGRPKKIKKVVAHASTLVGKDVRKMTAEELIEFKCMSISALGLPKTREDVLLTKYGIEKVGDLIKLTQQDMKEFRTNKKVYDKILHCIYAYHPLGRSVFRKTSELRGRKKLSPKLTIANANNFTKEEIFNSSVADLGISSMAQQALKDKLGIVKIADLMGKENRDVRLALNNNMPQFNRISKFLYAINEPLVITKGKKSQQSTIFEQDFSKLSDAEKELIWDKDISELGLTKRVQRQIRENLNVNTIKELADKSAIEIKKAINKNGAQYSKIYNGLLKLGINLKIKKGPQLTFDVANFANLSEEEKEKILNTDISEIGIHQKYVEGLNKKGVHLVKDFAKLSKNKTRIAVKNNQKTIVAIDQIVENLGLGYYSPSQAGRTSQISVDFDKLKSMNKEELLNQPLSVIGLNERYIGLLKDSLNISNIGDLIAKTRTQIRKATNFNKTFFNKIDNNLKEINLELVKKKRAYKKSAIENKKDKKKVMEETPKATNIFAHKTILSLVELSGQLKERGLFALYDLDNIFFVPGTQHFDDLKEEIIEYLNKKFENAINQATTLEAIEFAEKRLSRELELFDTIISQKKSRLYKGTDLDSKKQETTNKIKNNIKNRINKYHHKERFEPTNKVIYYNDEFGDEMI